MTKQRGGGVSQLGVHGACYAAVMGINGHAGAQPPQVALCFDSF